MSNSSDEPGTAGIDDDQLPEDLRPTDDNPLAKPLEDGEGADLGVPGPSELHQPDGEPDEDDDPA